MPGQWGNYLDRKIFLYFFLFSLKNGCSFAIAVPLTVGTLPSGQRKLDYILERNSVIFYILETMVLQVFM